MYQTATFAEQHLHLQGFYKPVAEQNQAAEKILKILHINTNDTGGAAIAAIRLHKLLLEHGIDSAILFLKRTGAAPVPQAYYFEDLYTSKLLFRLADKCNTLFNRRYSFYKPGVYFNGPGSLFRLSRHPLFREADIIHLHWVVKFLDWKTVFKRQNKRFVWTLHDMNPFSGGEHYQTGYRNEFKALRRIHLRQKHNALKDAQLTIVSPSGWLAGLARSAEVFSGKEIRCIRNPVDPRIFRYSENPDIRRKYGIDAGKKIVLFVAENPRDERKGFGFLLKALNELPEKNKLHLLIIGKELQGTEIPIAHSMTGQIREEEKLSALYSSADVFVIPSLEDNLPNTVSESLLCGTPVAGFRTGGIAEMVADGQNGFLSERPENLSAAIEKCLNAGFGREEIRALALRELDPEKLLGEFLSLYRL